MGKSSRGGKISKQRFTADVFVSANGEKVCDPVVIWRSVKPRCFKGILDLSRPLGVHYFGNKKAWMNTEIMTVVLKWLDRKVAREGR